MLVLQRLGYFIEGVVLGFWFRSWRRVLRFHLLGYGEGTVNELSRFLLRAVIDVGYQVDDVATSVDAEAVERLLVLIDSEGTFPYATLRTTSAIYQTLFFEFEVE